MGCGAIRYGATITLEVPAVSIFRSQKIIPEDRAKAFMRNDVYHGT